MVVWWWWSGCSGGEKHVVMVEWLWSRWSDHVLVVVI